MKQNKSLTGALMVLTAALLWSSNAPLVRWVTVDPFTTASLRALIAAAVLAPFFRPKRIRFNKDLICFLGCFTVLSTGVVLAIKMTGAPIAVGMQYTSGLWLFLCSRPKKKDFALSRIWPLVILSAGVIISMFSKADNVTMAGNLIALTTGFSFAGMTHFAKKIDTDQPINLSFLGNLTLGIITMIIAHPAPATFAAITTTEWFVFLYLGAIQIGVAYSLYYAGLRYTSASTASMLAPLEMILGPIWSAIFLMQYPDWIGIVGFVLVIIGVMGEAIRTTRKQEVTQ